MRSPGSGSCSMFRSQLSWCSQGTISLPGAGARRGPKELGDREFVKSTPFDLILATDRRASQAKEAEDGLTCRAEIPAPAADDRTLIANSRTDQREKRECAICFPT